MQVSFGNSIGKHKIPRNLYHLTTRNAWEYMRLNGALEKRRANDIYKHQGVYFFELTNFLKHWYSEKLWGGSLAYELLLKIYMKSEKFVLLKVSSGDLDNEKLYTRSINYLIHQRTTPKEEKRLRSMPNWKSHVEDGVSAKYSSLYEQKGHALEYIYQDDIPIDIVQKVGETDYISATRPHNTNEKKVHDVLYALFGCKNERKALFYFKH